MKIITDTHEATINEVDDGFFSLRIVHLTSGEEYTDTLYASDMSDFIQVFTMGDWAAYSSVQNTHSILEKGKCPDNCNPVLNLVMSGF